MYTYKIMYENKGLTDVIDETDSHEDAKNLVTEYKVAYGYVGRIWIKKEYA